MSEKEKSMNIAELKELLAAFKVRLIEAGINQAKWAHRRGLRPNQLSQVLHGHWLPKAPKKEYMRYLTAIRKFVNT